MVGRWAYDLLYRFGAPWEGEARSELVSLVDSGRIPPGRAVDLGCGSGANAVFLARRGFEVTGVDFSAVAVEKARRLARSSGVEARFVEADLTGAEIPGVDGPFDLVVDYGTLDDLRGESRVRMASHFSRLTRTRSLAVLWCFYGPFDGLPWVSLRRQSRMAGGLAPGEERRLFGEHFDIERLPEPPPGSHQACFVMTRR